MRSPFADCEATLMCEEKKVEFRKETFSYIESFYRCNITGLDFTTTELDDANIAQVYEQYREKYGIPSPAEITAIREKYGLSATKMSEILGLGINQYRLYEKGEMPSQSIGKMLALIADPKAFKAIIKHSRKQYSEKEYRALMIKIDRENSKSIEKDWNGDLQTGLLSGFANYLVTSQNNITFDNYAYGS